MLQDTRRSSAAQEIPRANPAARPEKRCICCKREKPRHLFSPHPRAKDGLRRSCKACVASGRASKPTPPEALARTIARNKTPEYRKVNRRSVRAWKERNPDADRAGRILRPAVKRGKIVPATCCQAKGCAETKGLAAHHYRYDRPLLVLWVCAQHHRRGHITGRITPEKGLPKKLGRVPKNLKGAKPHAAA
jgi:hypothetical protein